MSDVMPLDGWDHVELWVGNAKQSAPLVPARARFHADRLRRPRDRCPGSGVVPARAGRDQARRHVRSDRRLGDRALRVQTRRRCP